MIIFVQFCLLNEKINIKFFQIIMSSLADNTQNPSDMAQLDHNNHLHTQTISTDNTQNETPLNLLHAGKFGNILYKNV